MLNSSKQRLLTRRRSKRQTTDRPFVFSISLLGKRKDSEKSLLLKDDKLPELMTIPENADSSDMVANVTMDEIGSIVRESRKQEFAATFFEKTAACNTFPMSISNKRSTNASHSGTWKATLVTINTSIDNDSTVVIPENPEKNMSTEIHVNKHSSQSFIALDLTAVLDSANQKSSKQKPEEFPDKSPETGFFYSKKKSQDPLFHLNARNRISKVFETTCKKVPEVEMNAPKNKPNRKTIAKTKRHKKVQAGTDLELITEIIQEEMEFIVETTYCDENDKAMLLQFCSDIEYQLNEKIELLKTYKKNKSMILKLVSENKNLLYARYQLNEELLSTRHQDIEDRALSTNKKNASLIKDFLKSF